MVWLGRWGFRVCRLPGRHSSEAVGESATRGVCSVFLDEYSFFRVFGFFLRHLSLFFFYSVLFYSFVLF